MSTALAERDLLTVTPDQLDLVKRTVASGATDAELKLYLYDRVGGVAEGEISREF